MISDDFISSDKFLRAAGSGYNYQKRDFIFQPGRWRGNLILPPWTHIPRYFGKTLVIGHSDYSTSHADLMKLKLIGIRKVYGVNTPNWQNISESIPLGLSNDSDDHPFHRVFGNTEHLRIANEQSAYRDQFDGSVFVNFTVKNNPVVRKGYWMFWLTCAM